MNKLFACLTDGRTVTITADRMEQNECYIVAYHVEKMVGVFDLGSIAVIYLSEMRAND